MPDSTVRRRNLRLVLPFAYILVGTFWFLMARRLTVIFFDTDYAVSVIGDAMAAVLIFTGLGVIGFRYLTGSISIGGLSHPSPETTGVDHVVGDLRQSLHHEFNELGTTLISQVGEAVEYVRTQAGGLGFTDQDRSAVVDAVRKRIDADLTDNVLKAIDGKYSAVLGQSAYLTELRQHFERTRSRLLSEIAALGRRGNLNLVIGSLTTVAAVGLLACIVLVPPDALQLNPPPEGQTEPAGTAGWTSLWPVYVMRLSLAVFIEVFSFFFLRLYKSSLGEIKYFQNELTNVEVNFIALESAIVSGDKESMKNTLAEISRTERNVVLAGGESTVELEQLKNERLALTETLRTASDLVQSLKQK